MTTIFKTPFATQGDKASIPVEIQPDGSVSYTQGYGYDYERDQVTDPAAKDIEREKMNGIFHDITEAIGEIQSFGFPKWAEAGKPYAIRAIVYHKNKVWQSKIENNNIEPVAGNAWAELKADATASDVGAYSKGESDKRFQPLGNYTPSGYSYSKAETDTKYQPKGNYAPAGNYATAGSSYTKAESDGRYQAKGSYQPSGDYATNSELNSGLNNKFDKSNVTQSTGTSTVHVMSQKASTDAFQPKGSYQPAGNYALAGASYTKAESDGKYQPKGSYATAGSSYTKAESDGRYQAKGSYQLSGDYATNSALNSGLNNKFDKSNIAQGTGTSTVHVMSQKASTDAFQPKGSYQPAGNYALAGASYTKAESDGKYQLKGSYQASGYSYSKTETDTKYQPKGNYATAGSSYTKAESDGRYEKKGTGKSWRKVGGAGNSTSTITLTEDVRGKQIYFKLPGGSGGENWTTVMMPPVDNIGIAFHQGQTGFCDVCTLNNGKTLKSLRGVYMDWSEVWVSE
ncbi:hypothetical protein [Proteus terrae]|uniref:hypothetical protein n=1 Tax=Proteus terrae TaxID=1574161 RepID=UPI001E29C85A|nr:hypothetical protein [Proteus terrae]